MHILFRFAAPMALLLLTASAASALQNQDLIEKSGVAQQVKELQTGINSMIDELKRQGAPVDQTFEHAWAEAVPEAYKPDKILALIDQGLDKLLTDDEKRLLLEHYASAFGRRITDLEIQASKAEAQNEIQANVQQQMADPKQFSQRMALYQDIDQSCGATAIAVDMTMNVSLAMSIGLTSATAGPKEIDIDQLRSELEKQRPALTQQVSSQILATFAYAYRDLKTEELNSYLAFLKSPAAQKFNVGVGRLVADALTDQSHELGRLLGEILSRKRI
jgi:hypothetical protein